jgi:hypothetical protein
MRNPNASERRAISSFGTSGVNPSASYQKFTMARIVLYRVVQEWLQCLAKELSVKTRLILAALGLASISLFGTSVNESVAPIAVEETTKAVPIAPSSLPSKRSIATLPTSRSIAALPTIPAPPGTADMTETAAPRAGYVAASLPSLDPQRNVTSLPTVPPSRESEPARSGCDPAYPDERTCIPSGPPFDQGCAITDERRFIVVAPDPQGLDHDGDGIGCEPIGG